MARRNSQVAIVVGLVVVTAIALATTYKHHVRTEMRDRAAEELEAVARLEVQQIVRWIAERMEDAEAFAAAPSIAALAAGHGTPLSPHARGWLEKVAGAYGYRSVTVVTSAGAVLYAAGAAPTQRTIDAARAATRSGGPVVVDEVSGGAVSLLAAVPVSGRSDAAVVLAIGIEQQLIRVIETWPTAARTAELQLIRRERDDAVILSRTGGSEDARGQRVPITDPSRAAAKALHGDGGLLRGRDYGGAEVLAVAQPVPGLPWHVLAKIEEAEALEPAVRITRILHVGVVSVLALCAALGALVVKARRAAHLRKLWEAERDRVRAERGARRTAEHYQRVLEGVNDAVVTLDAGGNVTGWNRGAECAYGWAANEACGRAWSELVGTEHGGAPTSEVRAGGAATGTFDGLVRQRRKDGTILYAEARVVPLRDDEGGIVGHVAVTRDVTERHAAEEALRTSEERLQQVVDTTGAGIWDLDLVTGEAYVSPAWNRTLGYAPDARWDARRMLVLVHPDDRPTARAGFEAHCRGEQTAHEAELRLRAADGTWKWVHVRGRVVARGADTRPLRIVGANVDVTERRELQARLLLADRMSSMGMLAAGVAHEINNPLCYVLSNVKWARDIAARTGGAPCAPPEEIRTALAEAHEGAERVRDIVRDLRALSDTREDEVVGPVDLRSVVTSALQMARSHVKHRARVETEIGDVPPVAGTASRLGQVLLNLLVNAAQAIEAGAADAHLIRVRVRPEGPARVAVEISDTGRGIAPDVLPRIFDPFFTTKDVGEGTGLGLSIAHAIVTSLGGEIRVRSTVGEGTTFTILLRVTDRGPETGALANPEPLAPGRGRILVVDDEPHVATAIRRLLAPLHEVTTVHDGRAALDHVARSPCDVVLSDVLMPEMTGLELQRALAATSPALASRMIFMTGGAFTPETAEALAGSDNPCIDKPFDREQLLRAVARALA